jgi:hypothetical protein
MKISPIFQGSPNAIDRLIPNVGANAPENNLGNPLITFSPPFCVSQLRPHDNRENQSNDNFPFTKGIF